MAKKLKVGFDLDGVILYNPIRFVRPLAKSLKFIKPFIFKQKEEPFYFPQSNIEKLIWNLLHKTSFKVDSHFPHLKKLIQDGKIEAYLITGRYGVLKGDYNKWMKKIDAKNLFKNSYLNEKNMQPNIFKEEMIKELELDVFVEDNWDIIQKLNSHTKAKILWLSNFLDSRIEYPYKFGNLKEVIDYLSRS